MRSGDFEAAWKISDQVLAAHKGNSQINLPRHLQSIWDGSSLQGKRVLVRCYHGLGDTIQFIRYLPLLKALATKVIVWVQAPLIPLLKNIPEIDELLELHNGKPEATYDIDVEVMELPYIFRTTAENIPAKVPYLLAPSVNFQASHQELNIGLAWKAGGWKDDRSLPFEELLPLTGIEGIRFLIMQHNAIEAGWQKGAGIYAGDQPLFEFARTLCSLDLLITVDSMPAHLAGALAIPVWTLLHADADWRWMNKRNESPWYPTMRLFRQDTDGDWEKVIREVASELRRMIKERNS